MFSTNNKKKNLHLFHTLLHPIQGFTQLPAIQTYLLCFKISGIFLIFMLLSPRFLDIYAFVSQIFLIWHYLYIYYNSKSMLDFDSLCYFCQDDRGFFWFQKFSLWLPATVYQPMATILFSICHSYLSLHLLLILHWFFLHVFPPALSLFAFFDLFIPGIREVLDFLEKLYFFFFLNLYLKQRCFWWSIF